MGRQHFVRPAGAVSKQHEGVDVVAMETVTMFFVDPGDGRILEAMNSQAHPRYTVVLQHLSAQNIHTNTHILAIMNGVTYIQAVVLFSSTKLPMIGKNFP